MRIIQLTSSRSGGVADGKSVADLAKKHGVPKSRIEEQLRKGLKVEREHTSDSDRQREIAMDHLWELSNYYDLLDAAERAGETAMEDGLPEGLCPLAYLMAKNFVESTKDDWNYITPEELNKKGLVKFFVLDIRKPEDFRKGHLEGATNIFWMDLFKAENLKKLPKDKKILVYCYVGHTSSQALVLLRTIGFDVVSLKFGMGQSPTEGVPVAGWLDFGFETVK